MKSYLLAALSGALYFLSWAGFDLWPLSFVAFIPLLIALGPRAGRPVTFRAACGLGFVAGFVMNVGGYYWVTSTLQVFANFPLFVCLLLSSALWAYQGLSLCLFAVCYWSMRRARAPNLVAAPAALCIAEWLFPELFQHYFAGSLHDVPLALQIADVGGPLLVSGALMIANVGLYELARRMRDPVANLRASMVAAGIWAAVLGYGAYRIREVDGRMAGAPKIRVGLAQTNMGITAKRFDPQEGLRRHLEQSLELERKYDLDLLVWPESAFTWFLPESVKNVKRIVMHGQMKTPLLFGTLAQRTRDGELRPFNSALMADAQGNILGSYDKTYLLAFGEYMPLGDVFPRLYRLSKNSGRFSAGDHVRPLPLGNYRVSTLICYEDIIPEFVSRAVREGSPHLLVNITNDAWFGDSHEPWQHLALAKLRAVEHHRALVRSTNSGVSGFIDPVGRTILSGPVYERASLSAEVPLLQGDYLYLSLGNFPGYVSLLLAISYLAAARRTTKTAA